MAGVTDYRRHWDEVHRRAYAEGRRHWRPEHATPDAFLEFLGSSEAPPKGARILEAGCSDGLNAVYLARLGYRVTGVDASPAAIRRAREIAGEQGADVCFLCCDIVREALPGRGMYDLWVDIKTLHCLWDDDDRYRYLRAAASSLREDGYLFLNCGLALSDVRDHFPSLFASLDEETRMQADSPDRDLPREDRRGIRCETLDGYARELVDAGFRIVSARREASAQGGWGVVIVVGKGPEAVPLIGR